MSTINDQRIKVLNSLVEATLDSAHGYREAAKDAKNPRFKSLFERRSMERNQLTAELQSEVRGLGGKPEDDGTILASAHRVFLNLKHAAGAATRASSPRSSPARTTSRPSSRKRCAGSISQRR